MLAQYGVRSISYLNPLKSQQNGCKNHAHNTTRTPHRRGKATQIGGEERGWLWL